MGGYVLRLELLRATMGVRPSYRPKRVKGESGLPFGIISHATTKLATDRPAQINITIRNPNTNAFSIASLTAAFVVGLRPPGIGKPASLSSSD